MLRKAGSLPLDALAISEGVVRGMFCRDNSTKWHCLPSAKCGEIILMLFLKSHFSFMQVQQKAKTSRQLLKTPWQHICQMERSLKWSSKANLKWHPAKQHPTSCTNQLQEVQVAPLSCL